ncbi:Transcriptional regulator, AraC family [Burkholderia singularis]|uniref:Transcriptional regulator, AraC family n=1 Tax=Burkholderia singularis TaxID=1503053 RepID=A0A238H5U0_9BURK|nr:Transcriptional regulator, AraC family [Burkholderia singularis]
MTETFALHDGAFGRISLLSLRSGLVAHAHPDAHIVWWLGGAQAEARIGTEVFRYSATQASAVNPYEQHDLRLLASDRPALFLAVYIEKAWLEQKARTAGGPFLFPSPRIDINPALRAGLWQLLALILSDSEKSASIDQAVEQLIAMSVRASSATTQCGAKIVNAPVLSRKLRMAVHLMHERVDTRSTIDEIASEAGLSRARLFVLFRDQLNTTPQVFWRALRLEEAIRELINGRLPLASLAHELGFSAASNFSRFFKEHTGVSPSDYRRAAHVRSARPLAESML